MNKEKIIDIFESTGALLKGHFVLSSGLHSDTYFQCAKVLQFPEYLQLFAKMICTEFADNRPDLVISPAIGGIIIGYEIGRLLNRETIFCERVKKKFTLRRGFFIKKNTKVLIVEDVITTGKSSLECVKLIKKFKAKIIGFACIIDRSNKNKLKINKNKIVSQVKINVPTYNKKKLPDFLKKIPTISPGSRYLK